MSYIPFGEFKPDVNDFLGPHTNVLANVLPRGDGYGPVNDFQDFTAALPGACRGGICARNSDGSVTIFAATANRIFRLNNGDLTWVPVSKLSALTSITKADAFLVDESSQLIVDDGGNFLTMAVSEATHAIFTKSAHGLTDGSTIVLSTTGTLPTGLTSGVVYYVIFATTNTFCVSLTSGGAPVEILGDGSGTHSMTYSYTDVPSTDNWDFKQYGNYIVAVQSSSAVQVYDLTSSAAFADLSGSPPQARYVSVVGRQLVLSGLVNNPYRVHWSDIDDITEWTAGTGFANYVDLPDGGVVRGVAGGEYGILCQEQSLRRMTYVPGAKPSFQIDRISEDQGLLAPYSIVRVGGRVLFISTQGILEYSAGALTNVGKEKVNRTILDDIDLENPQLIIGSADPAGTRAFFAYKSVSSNDEAFDKMIAYDFALQRFSPIISFSGEHILPVVKPGLTLEALDSVSASIDALAFSLDSIKAALNFKLAAVNDSHIMGFFDGSTLEATMEIPEQGLDRRRVYVRGFEARSDAPTIYGYLKYRDNANASVSSTSEVTLNNDGFCPMSKDTRLARGGIRIPAGTNWTYALGINPDFEPSGQL